MDMLHNLALGLSVAATLQNLFYAFIGCMVGTLIGVLPGIGPVLANRITAYRRRFGPYRRVEDLLAVPGIGPKLYERLKPLVTVSDTGRQGR